MHKRIVIASILKPVDDTRLYEKIGISLGNTNKYEVNIIGFYSKKKLKAENINFYPLFNFSRLGFSRLIAPIRYLRKLFKVKPELILVTTPELLMVTNIYKYFHSCKTVYDIQENYHHNILFTNTYPFLIKQILAYFVRAVEMIHSNKIDYFFLAEKCYQQQLPFLGEKFCILENKFKGSIESSPNQVKNNKEIKLIFSGTISENYGIFQAIALTKSWYLKNNHIKLLIIGRCAHSPTLKKLLREIDGLPFIELKGGNTLVTHDDIITETKKAHYGLASYQPDKSIKGKIPTKLYEYMALKLPILIQNHGPWVDFCNLFNAAVPIDYNNYSIDGLLTSLKEKPFYSKGNYEDLLWDSEEKKLIKVVDKLIDP